MTLQLLLTENVRFYELLEYDGVQKLIIDYYIQPNINLFIPQKFIPGQDVDVWIKFVEASALKLTLQMYPPDGE